MMANQPNAQDPYVKQLEEALQHTRSVADAERRRAERAEESARRAWEMASWGGQRTRERDDSGRV